jgi:hypothetical protein
LLRFLEDKTVEMKDGWEGKTAFLKIWDKDDP